MRAIISEIVFACVRISAAKPLDAKALFIIYTAPQLLCKHIASAIKLSHQLHTEARGESRITSKLQDGLASA